MTETENLLIQAEIAGSTGSYELNLTTNKIRFSDGLFRLFGYEPRSIEPSVAFIDSISHPDDVPAIAAILADAVLHKKPYEYVRRIYTPDGDMRYILGRGKVVDKNEVSIIIGVAHDITQKTRDEQELAAAHEELVKNKNLLQSIFDTSLIGMSLLEPILDGNGTIDDFCIVMVSKELERQTKRKDLVGKTYSVEYPGIKKTKLFKMMLQVMANGKPQSTEYYYPYDGFDKWFSCTFVKMNDGLIASNLDITAQKNAALKIKELEEQQHQEIYNAVISTQEEERKRIAESLHNGIGQLLYAVKINLSQVLFNEKDKDQAAFHKAKKATEEILGEAIRESRRIAHQLTPTILEDFGLSEAVADICKQFGHKLTITCDFKGLNQRLNKYLEISIYRIIQELVMNIINHAKATFASIMVKQNAKEIAILIKDNGIGCQINAAKGNGMGLATVLNKVKLLNGTIDINGSNGTVITIKIPLLGVKKNN